MTHDELLAEVNQGELGWFYGWMQDALRAVVELHEPLGNVCNWCTCHDCEHIVDYPCKTIRAIQKELL